MRLGGGRGAKGLIYDMMMVLMVVLVGFAAVCICGLRAGEKVPRVFDGTRLEFFQSLSPLNCRTVEAWNIQLLSCLWRLLSRQVAVVLVGLDNLDVRMGVQKL